MSQLEPVFLEPGDPRGAQFEEIALKILEIARAGVGFEVSHNALIVAHVELVGRELFGMPEDPDRPNRALVYDELAEVYRAMAAVHRRRYRH